MTPAGLQRYIDVIAAYLAGRHDEEEFVGLYFAAARANRRDEDGIDTAMRPWREQHMAPMPWTQEIVDEHRALYQSALRQAGHLPDVPEMSEAISTLFTCCDAYANTCPPDEDRGDALGKNVLLRKAENTLATLRRHAGGNERK